MGPRGEEGGRSPELCAPYIRGHVIRAVSAQCVLPEVGYLAPAGKIYPWSPARCSLVGGSTYTSPILRPTYQAERHRQESRVTGEIASKLPSSLTVQICILIRLNGIQLPDTKFLSLIPSKDATETDQKPKAGAEQSPAGLSLQEISHLEKEG